MPKIVKYGLILFAITAATGLILGGVYTMTLEPIRLVQEQEKNEALASTLPGATEFKAVEIKDGNPMITEIYEGSANGEIKGYNFTVTPKGYAGLITTVVGVSNEGRVMDIKILSHSETPGLGANSTKPAFKNRFVGKSGMLTVSKTSNDGENVQAITAATITSKAVTSAVNAALAADRALEGGAS